MAKPLPWPQPDRTSVFAQYTLNLFTIQLQPLGQARRHALRQIRIAARDAVFTRLLREPGNQLDDWLQAEPAPLAYWLCDHWWRLRWEGVPTNGPSPDWRLSHDVAATGGGYAWPRLSIWGDVDRIGLHSQADPAGVVGPVRYLTDALVYVDAGEFEAEVDRFLAQVVAEHRENGAEPIALEALIAALTAERQDPEVARWRRLEARLGYDPDAGPDDLIASADTLATRWGLEAVEEAFCATPGSMATETLAGEVSFTQQYGQACDFSAILTGIEPVPRNACAPPWVAAADHFHVGERVVQTVLRNKDVIPRQRFEDLVEAA